MKNILFLSYLLFTSLIIVGQVDSTYSEDYIFVNPEKMPTYKYGSSKDLQLDILRRLVLPMDACIEGIMVIDFKVDENGVVKDPKIGKGLIESIDSQFLELILEYEFYPGEFNGVVVPMWVRLPLRIKMD